MPSRGVGADRRQAILSAARALAAESGAQLTMDKIASRAGVTKATVYRYFSGKAAIVEALHEPEDGGTADLGVADAEARRRRVLEAALRCIARWGFRGATMNRIGREAGLSAAAIYWYFPSKEHLIAAVLEAYTPMPQLRQLRQLPIGAEDEQLREIVSRVLDVLAGRLDVIKTILSEGFSRPEMFQDFYREVSSKFIAEITAYIDRRVEAGVFRPGPPVARAMAFVSPLLLYALARRNLGDRLPLSREEAVEEFVSILLDGLRAPIHSPADPTHPASTEAER